MIFSPRSGLTPPQCTRAAERAFIVEDWVRGPAAVLPQGGECDVRGGRRRWHWTWYRCWTSPVTSFEVIARYVEALGGRLDLVADFGDRTVRLPVTNTATAA
jgi:hypothetical protein